MTIDEMRQKAASSNARASSAADRNHSGAGPLMLASTLWWVCAEICERLDAIAGADRAEVLEDRERGLS